MSPGTAGRAVLLDTCAVIWLANGDRMEAEAIAAILAAGRADGILVSPVSAWEVGLLSRKRLAFAPDPQTWFARVMGAAGIRPAPLTPAVAIAAAYLPGPLHGDPGDRLIVATARHLGVPVVTRDRRIIDYAETGHVAAIAC